MSDRVDENDAEEEDEKPKPPPRPRRPRRPTDWVLVTWISGTIMFLAIYGAITLMAPRRPFLAIRGLSTSRPALPAPAGLPVGLTPAPGAPAPGTAPPPAANPGAPAPAAPKP
jgi:hypothetical protein